MLALITTYHNTSRMLVETLERLLVGLYG